jgi:hypothetical protein
MLKPIGKIQGRSFRGILDSHQRRSILGLIECLSYYYRDGLAIEPNDVILQNVQSFTGRIQRAFVLKVREPGCVLMRDDCNDARNTLGPGNVQRGKPAFRNRTGHDDGIGQIREIVICGVFGAASHLE